MSYDQAGPRLSENDYRHPAHDVKYKSIPKENLPTAESMADMEKRVVPFWENQIERRVKDNKQIIIVSHKNTLRAIFKHL